MGSYNSANFTKLIVNSIPYNKAYMGSKILFENNNSFTLEITGYKDGNSRASLYYRKGTNTQENCTFYITCGNNTYTKHATNTTGSYLKDDNNNRVYFYSGDKIKIKVVYDNNDTPVIGNNIFGAGIALSGCYYKAYGDLSTYNTNGYYSSLLSTGNSGVAVNGLIDISGIMWPETVSQYCYYHMFSGQENLTGAVDLPATTLAFRCYTRMFYHTGVTDITMHALDYSSQDAATAEPGGFNQFYMTDTQPANGGVFRLPAGNNLGQFQTIEGKAPDASDQKWTIQPIGTPLQTNPITVTTQGPNNRVYFKCLSTTATIKYNDNVSYQTLSQGDEITLGTLAYQGDTLQVKYAYTGIVSLMATGDFAVSGDIADVNNGDTPGMFKDSVHLKSASALTLSPTTLVNECYYQMFMGCTGLTSQGMPTLTATTLADNCYDSMFKGCTGLTGMYYFRFSQNIQWASKCCYEMFQGCTGLTAAEISPTGYPTNYWYNDDNNYQFYYMFEGCSQLNGLYFYGDLDSNYSTGTVYGIVDNCAATGKIYVQEDLDFTDNVMRSIAPQGWIVEEDDSNF